MEKTKSKASQPGQRARRSRLLALEPRILFDGVALHDTSGLDSAAPPPASGDAGVSAGHDSHLEATTAPSDIAALSEPALAAAPSREIFFIDSSVPDADSLIAGLRSNIQVVVLDPERDSLQQIAAVLGAHPDTTAVHLVSHGGPGFLTLGGRTYTEADLSAQAEVLAQWRAALSQNADILLYGCDVAAGSQGQVFLDRLAELTGADVAASSDATGGVAVGGDWQLESATGSIETAGLLTDAGAAAYDARLSTIALNTNTGWTPVLTGVNFDPINDTQARAADTDLLGDASHAVLYAAYDDGGTPNDTSDDRMAFRIRVGNPTSSTTFGGVALIGMDANGDGRIDLFLAVDGRNNSQSIRLLDPGTGLNHSPNTTSTSALPTGWIASNGVYAFSSANYAVTTVSAATDPNWNGNTDLGGDGKTDIFVSFKVPLVDVAAVLAKASPTDRYGTAGPRGSGIANFGKDSAVKYVVMTQTQLGSINGDIGGVGAVYDRNMTFAALGAFSAIMTPANPVADAVTLTIDSIDADGVLNAVEDNTATIFISANLADHSKTISVTITDSNNASLSGNAVFDSVSGKWKLVQDVSSLANGALTVRAEVDPDGDVSNGSVSDTKTVDHEKTGPLLTIDQLATTTAGTPTISGTTDLPAGALITVTLDTDNNAATTNVVFQALVVAGGGGINTWSVNTATAVPVSGSVPVGGFSTYTKITAQAADLAGNTASALSLNRPTVLTISTSPVTPTLSGTWTNIPGDILTVTVNGATYTLAPNDNTWTLDLLTAIPTSGSLLPLVVSNTYGITATVTRPGTGAVSDTTSAELTILSQPTTPTIGINGGSSVTTGTGTPILSGTSANAGGYVVVRLDPNNDGLLLDAVTYFVKTANDGSWTLDTATATPAIGLLPGLGLDGNVGVRVTDGLGLVSAVQSLLISKPSVAITSIETGILLGDSVGKKITGDNKLNMTEDDSVTISGTLNGGATLLSSLLGADRPRVSLVISDANGNRITVASASVTIGLLNDTWSVSGLNLSGLDSGTLTVTATAELVGTTVTATNTSVVHDTIAPRIFITTPTEIKKSSSVIYGGSELANTSLTVTVRNAADLLTVYSTTVTTDANGDWSLTTPSGTNLIGGSTGNVIIRVAPTAQTTDAAGNIVQQASKTQYVTANGSTATIAVGTIAGDNVISVNEITGGLTITGTTSLTTAATSAFTVTVTDGSTTQTATMVSNSSGTWTASLTQAQVQALRNGALTVTATVLDSAASITVSDVALPTLSLPTPVLTITDSVAGTAYGPVTYTFSFSESMSAVSGRDFLAADITVTNGTKGTFTKIDATTYTLVVTPNAGSTGTMTVSVAANAAYGTDSGRGNTSASVTQAFNTTDPTAAIPPTLTIDASALVSDSTPVITGTTNLPAGSPVMISIDPDNDSSTSNTLSYAATVQANGTWSLDVGSAAPTSGTLPASGVYTWARITATATSTYGYSTTVTALDQPLVTQQLTNDSTPTISGTWTNLAGDTLSVTVNGKTYTPLTSANSPVWTVTIPDADALADGTYNVIATTTRTANGASVSDTSTSELVIDTTAPAIAITSSATGNDRTPTITGTSNLPAGSPLTVTLDPDNNPATANNISYIVVIGTDGTWTLNTDLATPTSGSLPEGGLNGDIGVRVTGTDAAGNQRLVTQTLTIDASAPVISILTNAKTPDTTPVISGTSDLPPGSTITVVVDPDNVVGGTTHTYTATVTTGGLWSIDTGTAIPAGGSTPVTYTTGNTLGISATSTDAAGNTGSASKTLLIADAPVISVTTPIDSGAGQNSDGTLSAAEDDNVILRGTATVDAGSTLLVTITDGVTTLTDTALVGSDGSWQLAALNLSGLANGLISITATYTDAGGDAYSGSSTVLHDKLSGSAVSIDSISSDTGNVGDFITSDTTLVFSGSATAGATVTLQLTNLNGTVFSTSVTADSSGTWRIDRSGSPLTAGAYTLIASTGGITATQAVVIDTTAPTGPITVTPLTSSSSTPTITGTATLSAGDMLRVTVNGRTYLAGDGHLSRSGSNWSLTLPADATLENGTYDVTATLSDAAGNLLSDLTSSELTISNRTPAAPLLSLLPASDSGTSSSDLLTNVVTPTLRVTLQGTGDTAPVAGDIVKIFHGAIQVGTATLSNADIAAGYIDIPTSALGTDGTKSLSATVTHITNSSASSNLLGLTVDATPPVLQSVTVDGATLTLTYIEGGSVLANTALSPSDFTVLSDNVGIGVSSVVVDTINKTVTLTLNSGIASGATALLSYVPGAGKIQDLAGNTAGALTNVAVTVNTAIVLPPSRPDMTSGTDSGLSSSDDITKVVRPAFTGTALPLASVTLYDGNTQIGTAHADLLGNWSITANRDLSAGSHTITARQSVLGIVSIVSPSLEIVVDPTPPALAGAAVNGSTLTLMYTETGSGLDASTPVAGDFTVTSDGNSVAVTAVVLDVANKTITLTLAAPIPNGSTVLLNYTPGTQKLQDVAGNTALALTAQPVANGTAMVLPPSAPDLAAPSDSGDSSTDDITQVQRPVFTGTATPGATVTLYEGNVVIGTGTADGNGDWSITSTVDLSDGAHTIHATQTSGGITSLDSAAIAVVIDSTPPVLATASVEAFTVTLTYTETGSGIASSTPLPGDFTLTADGVPVAITAVALDPLTRTLTLTLGAPVLHGQVAALSYTPGGTPLKDVAGNPALALSAEAVVNTTPDVPPLARPDMTAASDSGATDSDDVTNVLRPSFTGNALPLAFVTLYDGNTVIGTALADAQGAWSITANQNLSEGAHAIRATQTLLGIVSLPSGSLDILIDTTAPIFASASVDINTLTLAYTETGSGMQSIAPAAADYTVLRDGVAVAVTAVVVDPASKTVTLTLAEPIPNGAGVTLSYSLGANRLQDVAGNAALAFHGAEVVNNTAVVPAPTTPDLAAASDSGVSALDNVTRETRPVFIGVAASGATVHLFDGNTLIGIGIADGSGNWSILTNTDLSAGTHTIRATQTVAGLVSAASADLEVFIDATPPLFGTAAVDRSTLTLSYIETGSGFASVIPAASDFMVTRNGVSVTVSSVSIDAANKVVTLTLAEPIAHGDTALVSYVPDTNRLQDIAGNTAAALNGVPVTNNTAQIPAPTAPDLESDSGQSASDDITNTRRPAFTGNADAGALVTLYRGSDVIGTATADAYGVWSITAGSDFAEGAHTLHATQTIAGLTSAASATLEVLIDITPPSLTSATVAGATLTVGFADAGSGIGSSTPAAADFIVIANVQTIAVTAVSLDASSGMLTLTLAHTVIHTDAVTLAYVPGVTPLRDVAGNAANAFAGAAVINHTSAVLAPTVPDMTAGTDTGTTNVDNITRLQRPVFTGTGAAGALVTLYADNTLIGSGTADGNGSWSITPVNHLAIGTHVITARQEVAGTVSDPSLGLQIVIDNMAPALVAAEVERTTLNLYFEESGSDFESLTPDVADFAVSRNGVPVSVTAVQFDPISGIVSLTLAAPIEAGEAVLVSYVPGVNALRDIAGNTVDTFDLVPVINHTAPVLPPTTPDLVDGHDSGVSTNDNTTRTLRPTFTGLANASALVTLYDGSTVIGIGVAGSDGIWNITAISDLAGGAHDIHARQTVDGITGGPSASLPIVIDATVPVLQAAEIDGNTVALSYLEAGSQLATTTPDTSDFIVTRNGSAIAISDINVDTDTKMVMLTLSTPVVRDDIINVSYAPGAAKLQDVAGNLAAGFANHTVVNRTPAPPVNPPANPPVNAPVNAPSGPLPVPPQPAPPAPPGPPAGLPPSSVSEPVQPTPAVSIPLAPVTTPTVQDQPAAPPVPTFQGPAWFAPSAGSGMPATSMTTDALSTSTNLDSTDRGFAVTRLQTPAGGAGGDGNTAIGVLGQQKGVDRLFVYKGIRDTFAMSDGRVDYVVPREAFGHTDNAAIVYLDAVLSNGAALPDWLEFNPVSGHFIGMPPEDVSGELEIRVIARDNQGREVSDTFRIQLRAEAARAQAEGKEAQAALDAKSKAKPGSKSDSKPEGKATSKAETQTAARKAMPFGEQLKLAKPVRDPLLARMADTEPAQTSDLAPLAKAR